MMNSAVIFRIGLEEMASQVASVALVSLLVLHSVAHCSPLAVSLMSVTEKVQAAELDIKGRPMRHLMKRHCSIMRYSVFQGNLVR